MRDRLHDVTLGGFCWPVDLWWCMWSRNVDPAPELGRGSCILTFRKHAYNVTFGKSKRRGKWGEKWQATYQKMLLMQQICGVDFEAKGLWRRQVSGRCRVSSQNEIIKGIVLVLLPCFTPLGKLNSNEVFPREQNSATTITTQHFVMQ